MKISQIETCHPATKQLPELLLALLLPIFVSYVDISHADEQSSPLAISASTAIYNTYISRGVISYSGVSLQPSATLSYDSATNCETAPAETCPYSWGSTEANIWAHLPLDNQPSATDLQDDPTSDRFVEVDATLAYKFQLSDLNVAIGNVWYDFYNDDLDQYTNTSEIFSTLEYPLAENISGSIAWYYDYQTTYVHYIEPMLSFQSNFTSAGHDIPISIFTQLGLGANANNSYSKDSGLLHITTGFSLELPLNHFTLTPICAMTAATDDSASDQLWFGLTVE